MTARHTPGPWWVEIETAENAEWSRKWPTIDSENYQVVGTEGLYGDIETDIANANLIAAAPDLLAALMDAVRVLGNDTPASVWAAITKAKGEK